MFRCLLPRDRLLQCTVPLVLGVAILTSTDAQAERRALIIGNASYADSPLRNPVNDARAVDNKLKRLHFVTTRVENLRRDQIGTTVSRFVGSIHPGDEIVVFYAGHGLQFKGENYFPAVDAHIRAEDDVPLNSLNLNNLLTRLDESRAGVKLVFLDACRNNPFAVTRGSQGLAKVEAPSGTIIQFATRPGSVAADGSGGNGLYTQELLRALDGASEPVELTLKHATAGVKAASHGEQEPWIEGSFVGEFCFAGCASSASASGLRQDAQSNLDGSFPARHGETRERPKSAAAAVPLAAGSVFQDCPDCPEMVVLPSGQFEAGSSADESGHIDNEGPDSSADEPASN